MQKDKKINILLLEDSEQRVSQFYERFDYTFGHFKWQYEATVVNNAHEAIKALKSKDFGLLFLDHDLEEQVENPSPQNKGATVTDWIAQNKKKIKSNLKYPIFIHSMNPEGARTMHKTLTKAGILAHKVPGIWVEHKFNQYFNFENEDEIA